MKQRPFSELTKHFTAEDWAYVDEGLEEIREEVAREKAARELEADQGDARSRSALASGDMALSGHDAPKGDPLEGSILPKPKHTNPPPQRDDEIYCPGDEIWRDRVKADLAAQLEAGGTLYGYRDDGAYVATTKHGDRIISRRPKSAESRRSV